jgi:AcrR family transcriptional regulator
MALERTAVAREAIGLLDQVGLDQLTMRRLAAHLNVQNPSLYWHFSNKRDLLNFMTQLLVTDAMADLNSSEEDRDWAEWITAFARALRRVLLAHRDGARLFAEADLMIDPFVQTADTGIRILVHAGFRRRSSLVSILMIFKYVLGAAFELQSNPVHGAGQDSAGVFGVDPDRYPGLASIGTAPGAPLGNAEAIFEEGLEIILNGMRAMLARTGV